MFLILFDHNVKKQRLFLQNVEVNKNVIFIVSSGLVIILGLLF